MKVNNSEMRILFDVDGTLIKKDSDGIMALDYYGITRRFSPIHSNILFLKSQHQRGFQVTVHSANGVQWAKQVVEALGLQEFVYEVATKPLKYVDDKPADSWMALVFVPEGDL